MEEGPDDVVTMTLKREASIRQRDFSRRWGTRPGLSALSHGPCTVGPDSCREEAGTPPTCSYHQLGWVRSI